MHHARKSDGTESGRHVDRVIDPISNLVSQVRTNVSQRSEITFAGMVGPGAHPFSVIVSGSIFTEYAFPAGTWVVPSQSPPQGTGAFQ
jgi:hypothetical protein